MGKPNKQRKRSDGAATEGKKPAAARRPGWQRHGWRLLAIWGLLAIAYSNSFQSGLVLDNAAIIARDPRIRQATAQNVLSILDGGYRYNNPNAGLYRPLTTLSYMVNYAVFGDGARPAGYHWVNLALHCVNVALVYALGIAVFSEIAPAFALAAIWGLHPVLTESVTNIVGRADLLAAFGVLAGLLCYRKAESAAARGRMAWLAGLVAAQAIGVFSKESAVVLPGLMLLYSLTWAVRTTWRARASAYAVLLLPLAAFFYLRGQAHAHMLIPFADNPLVNAGFWTARLTAIKVIGHFLGLFLWPAHLSADYSFNAVPIFGGQASNWEDVQGAHRAGCLPCRSGANRDPCGARAIRRKTGSLLSGVLLRCVGAHIESHRYHRQHHGGAVSLSAFRGSGWIGGCGDLRASAARRPCGHEP